MPRPIIKTLCFVILPVMAVAALAQVSPVPPCIRSIVVTTCDGVQHDLTSSAAVTAAVSAALGSASTQPATQPVTPATQPVTQPSVYAPKTPPLPTTFPAGWAVHVAGSAPKGYGIYSVGHTAAQSFANQYISGFDQNACSETYAGGLSISSVISVNALHDPANLFDGQGWYFSGISGPISVANSCFAWNGWQTSGASSGRGMYYHGNYFNAPNSAPTIGGCLYASNSACQIQTRVGGAIDSCVFVDSGIGVLNVMGPTTISNCTFIGGHYYWSGSAWAGNAAVYAYWPVKLIDCVFVAVPGQGAAPTTIAGAETYPTGCIVSGGAWANGGEPPWTAPPGGAPLVTATNCTICGAWPGGNFAGASPASGVGFTMHAGIDYDPTPVVDAVIAGTLSPSAGQARIQSAVRLMVGSN